MAKVGRPKIPYDEKIAQQVQAMAQYGVSQDAMEDILGISAETIRNLYDKQWRKGKSSANAKIAQSLYAKASDGDTACMMFWLKTQAGWRETNKVEVDAKVSGTLGVSPPTANQAFAEMVSMIKGANSDGSKE